MCILFAFSKYFGKAKGSGINGNTDSIQLLSDSLFIPCIPLQSGSFSHSLSKVST
jgi:hypothetical protein